MSLLSFKKFVVKVLVVSTFSVIGLVTLSTPAPFRQDPSHLSFRILGSAGEVFNLGTVPDGYPEGRSTAPYGAYSTPYFKNAREISDALNALERKVYGLSDYERTDEVKQATAVFYFEHQALGILKDILNRPDGDLSEFERESLKAKAVRVYSDIRYHGERLYQTMVRRVDVALPGPNGSQLRIEKKLKDGSSQFLYLSNCRLEKCPTEDERKSFYQNKLKDFLAAGGKLSDMVELNKITLEGFGPFTRVEYVERPDGSVWVTKGDAGHALLAKGGPVQSAGQIVLVKNAKGEVEYLIISNASGTYKPDLYSVQLLAAKLRKQFGVSPENVVLTQGEPLGSQTVKVLLKSAGVPKDGISTQVKAMEAEAGAFLKTSNGICQNILAAIAGSK